MKFFQRSQATAKKRPPCPEGQDRRRSPPGQAAGVPLTLPVRT